MSKFFGKLIGKYKPVDQLISIDILQIDAKAKNMQGLSGSLTVEERMTNAGI
jgi:hypothetical protein